MSEDIAVLHSFNDTRVVPVSILTRLRILIIYKVHKFSFNEKKLNMVSTSDILILNLRRDRICKHSSTYVSSFTIGKCEKKYTKSQF